MSLEEQKKDLEETLKSLESTKSCVESQIEDINNQIKEAKKPKFNETWKPKIEERYYFITSMGSSNCSEWCNDAADNYRFNFGNCYKTQKQAEQRAKEIKVYNLLKNFSDANGGDEIDWKDRTQSKHHIRLDGLTKNIGVISQWHEEAYTQRWI